MRFKNKKMAQENQDYLQGLEKIVNIYNVDRLSKDYLRYKAGLLKKNQDGSEITDSQFIIPLGGTINPDDSEMFVNETQASVEKEVKNYQQTRKGEIDNAFNQYKNNIISDYAKGINKIIEGSADEIKSRLEEKLKDLPADEKQELLKQNLEINLYHLIGSLIKDLDLTKDYKANKDLVEAVNGLKELNEAEQEERKDIVADKSINKNRLTDNYRNFRRDWNNMYEQMRINYLRVIGKQLLKESNGKYRINEELLKQAYCNVESIKEMSPSVKAKYEAQKKAS